MGRAGASLSIVVLGGGLVLAAGAPTAGAQASSACTEIEATLATIQQTLPKAAASGTLESRIGAFVSELNREAATTSSGVRRAVAAFTSELEAAGKGQIDVAALTAKANAIGAACTASASALPPVGAPATGGGGTAGFEDAGLLAAGSAAIVVGGAVVALELRRRRRPL